MVDPRGRPQVQGGYQATERPAIVVVTTARLFIFFEDDKFLDATVRDAPRPTLAHPPHSLASLAEATIGFKFDWLALDFDDAPSNEDARAKKTRDPDDSDSDSASDLSSSENEMLALPVRVTFPTHNRDATLALVNAVVPVAKELRAAAKGLRGDAGRRGAVKVNNDDAQTLDLLTRVAFAPNNDADGVPLLYASCLQFWNSRPGLSASRVLVLTNKRLYLLDDDLGAFIGLREKKGLPVVADCDYGKDSASAANLKKQLTARHFKLLESLPWRRARSVQLADDPGSPCELVLTFVDSSYHGGFFKNWRTWRLRFPHHLVCHAACDLIQARLNSSSLNPH